MSQDYAICFIVLTQLIELAMPKGSKYIVPIYYNSNFLAPIFLYIQNLSFLNWTLLWARVDAEVHNIYDSHPRTDTFYTYDLKQISWFFCCPFAWSIKQFYVKNKMVLEIS